MTKDTFLAWLKDTVERGVWTFIQGATAVLTAEQFDLLELGDGGLWTAAAAGGIGAIFSALKSAAAAKVSSGNTAQLGVKTYDYEAVGPGAAGADV